MCLNELDDLSRAFANKLDGILDIEAQCVESRVTEYRVRSRVAVPADIMALRIMVVSDKFRCDFKDRLRAYAGTIVPGGLEELDNYNRNMNRD